MNRWLVLLLIVLSALSCAKDGNIGIGYDSDRISFYLYQPDAGYGKSKAMIDGVADMQERKLPLFVTDLMEFHSSPSSHTGGVEYSYDEKSRLWSNDDAKWENRLYEFYAYVISNPTSASRSNGIVELRSVGEAHPGRYIDIYQPLNYSTSADAWADYLLSYRVEADGTYRPLVRLELERVTAAVELYISTPEGSSVRLKKITFTDVVRCARLSIAEHAVSTAAIEGRRNKWVIQEIDTETQTTSYTLDDVPVKERAEGEDRFGQEFRVMRFLTVPQDIRDEAHLKLEYEVEEGTGNWESYTADFQLRNPALHRWDIGHKARYYVGLDTSVEMEGLIEEWNGENYLSGTFLPELDTDTE